MRTVETTVTISASPSQVWATLIDFDSYSQWNPFMVRVRGEAVVGARLEVTIRLRGGRQWVFRPVVLTADPAKRLRWLGHLLVPKIFDGLHEFLLEPDGGNTVLVHREEFSGLLSPVMGGLLDETREGFEQFNTALRDRVLRTHR